MTFCIFIYNLKILFTLKIVFYVSPQSTVHSRFIVQTLKIVLPIFLILLFNSIAFSQTETVAGVVRYFSIEEPAFPLDWTPLTTMKVKVYPSQNSYVTLSTCNNPGYTIDIDATGWTSMELSASRNTDYSEFIHYYNYDLQDPGTLVDDCYQIRRYILGDPNNTVDNVWKVISADVNNDGYISSFDIFVLQAKIEKNIEYPGLVSSWRFLSYSHFYDPNFQSALVADPFNIGIPGKEYPNYLDDPFVFINIGGIAFGFQQAFGFISMKTGNVQHMQGELLLPEEVVCSEGSPPRSQSLFDSISKINPEKEFLTPRSQFAYKSTKYIHVKEKEQNVHIDLEFSYSLMGGQLELMNCTEGINLLDYLNPVLAKHFWINKLQNGNIRIVFYSLEPFNSDREDMLNLFTIPQDKLINHNLKLNDSFTNEIYDQDGVKYKLKQE